MCVVKREIEREGEKMFPCGLCTCVRPRPSSYLGFRSDFTAPHRGPPARRKQSFFWLRDRPREPHAFLMNVQSVQLFAAISYGVVFPESGGNDCDLDLMKSRKQFDSECRTLTFRVERDCEFCDFICEGTYLACLQHTMFPIVLTKWIFFIQSAFKI